MRHGSSAVRLMAFLVGVAATASAQQQPKPQDLPDAPVAKQESAQKRQNRVQTTIEVLERRSIFFPDIATSAGPLSVKQKFELFADQSIPPSRLLISGSGAGKDKEQISQAGHGQGKAGHGKRYGNWMDTAYWMNFLRTFGILSA